MTLWADGRFLADDTHIAGVLDPGFTVGDGLFETMAVYHGRIFALDQHLNRLTRSITSLGFTPVEWEVAEVCRDIARRSRALPVARLRVTLWNGSGNTPHLAISLREEPHAPELGAPQTTDACVGIGPWERDPASPLSGHKSTSYGGNIAALRWGRTQSFDEVLWRGRWGGICEGSTANLLFFHEGKLCTPADDSGCLPGVTRDLFIGMADDLGGVTMIPAHNLSAIDLEKSGLALVGTFRNIHPVGSVDGCPLPVPPQLREAQVLFADRMQEYLTD